ncbi:hypothetical protein D9619_001431 [Psilocybe cf. subviscida]|uniref:Uncharacterized protein n=1 Tax=Psilocybe cf. subviscida TaxID=2480587 RepID=A0A8H5BGX6_9AGAR|nr:hypothetical protein D9619_001431 [Psilocybe cf. subviscida]
MTLQKMHKRGEAGRRGEVAARYAASHPAEDLVGRGDKVAVVRRADAKADREPTTVPPRVIPTAVPAKPVVPSVPVVKPTVIVKPTEPAVKPTVLPTSASAVVSKPPVVSTPTPPTSASTPATSATTPTTLPTISTPVTPTVSPTPSTTPLLPSSLTASVPVLSPSPSHRSTASAAGASASTSTVPQPASGLGIGSIIGIIAGVCAGLLVLGLVVSFFLRRLRTRTRDTFKANTFRRSAIMLKDDDHNEKDFRPRPPSMIERRNAATPVGGNNARANVPSPSMAYPYSDQVSVAPSAPASLYGQEHPHQYPQFGAGVGRYAPAPLPPSSPHMYNALPGAYGIPPPMAPYGGAQYEQAGFGAPPVPGTYAPGAYATYGQDPRYQQYPHHQHQGYPQQYTQYQQRPEAHQQPMSYGNAAADLTRSESLTSGSTLPNPFARSPASSPPAQASSSLAPAPISEKQRLRAAELQAESSSSSASGSSSSSSSASGSSTSLARRPTQVSGAPPAYVDDGDSASWASRRDQKRANEVVMSVSNSDSEARNAPTIKQAPAATPRTTQVSTGERPISSFTLYGDESDAYGGI